MTNSDIAQILSEMADYYEMDEVPFRPRAYQKAAATIADWDEPLGELFRREGRPGLLQIPGVGPGLAEHLQELLQTGKLKHHQQFQKKYPVRLAELRQLQGVGPRTIRRLYEKLGIRNSRELARAAAAHKLQKLAGFGAASEQKILESLHFQERHRGRFVLGHIIPVVDGLLRDLQVTKQFLRLEVGGSFRRRQETVGDIDILATAQRPAAAMAAFVNLPQAAQVLQHGTTKSEIRLQNGLQVDLRIVPKASWGAALQYFTGDKAHNVHLRKLAIARGWKLSEYGLFKGRKIIAGADEAEIYEKLGLALMPPELRTDSGEIEAAAKDELPKLLPYGSVVGDLQTQTEWTDGQDSIAEMAAAAQQLGRQYIAITDHTKTLYMAHGLDEKRLLQQMKEIDKLNSKIKNHPPGRTKFRILKGAEVNILKDGSLDIADKVLAQLDVVGVSIHSLFQMNRRDMTARIIRAIANPHVDILFHPTTRIIQQRGPIEFDFAAVLTAAKQHRVALEIDAYPDRLDLHDTLIRQAVTAGVKLTIDSDAHSVKHLDYLYLGEAQARRGWATKADILNTQSAEKLLQTFKP